MFSKKPDEAVVKTAPIQASALGVVAKQAETQRVVFRYVDRPDCLETFADSLIGLVVDGQSLRLEFGVSRLDERKADMPLSGRRYPVCRLVLAPAAVVELINKLQYVAAAVAKPQDDLKSC